MDPVTYSRPSSAVITQIEDAKAKKDWFFAVVFSAIHLERQAFFFIRDYLESREARFNSKTLENLHLPQLALFLLALGKIGQDDYDAILQMNKARNKFIHRREHYKYKIGSAADQEYGQLIEKILNLLKGKLRENRIYISRN